MKELQKLLGNYDSLRVEIYWSTITLYDTETCDEHSFETIEEVVDHLKRIEK